ncbi:MAG: hypothetical protein JST93_36425 [Acidobacteria bacterium]|nr:hypothetical protein [Acidobacteriota bacterium]
MGRLWVIQAKCKEKPQATEEDQDWALGLLKKELQLFETSEKRTPKPEYYVFVVNVELSSGSGGAKDQANNLVEQYYPKLGLKGHAVWDANQLRGYVDKHAELRQRFCNFLTTGDLIAHLMGKKPQAERILQSFLIRELQWDVAARLDQAGKKTDEQMPLAELFIDLPASEKPQLEPPKSRRRTAHSRLVFSTNCFAQDRAGFIPIESTNRK